MPILSTWIASMLPMGHKFLQFQFFAYRSSNLFNLMGPPLPHQESLAALWLVSLNVPKGVFSPILQF